MSPDVIVQVVGRLFAGAGRRHDEVTLQAWHEALEPERDDDAVPSAIEYLRSLGPNEAPNVSAYLAVLRSRARRRSLNRRGLPEDTSPITDADQAKANIARLRNTLAQHPIKHLDDELGTSARRRRHRRETA